MAVDGNSVIHDPANRRWSQAPQSQSEVESQRTLFAYSISESSRSSSKSSAASEGKSETLPFGSNPGSVSKSQATSIAMDGASSATSVLRTWSSVDAVTTEVVVRARELLSDHVTPLRLAGHLSVVAVAAIILFISQVDLPTWDVTIRLLPEGAHSISGFNSSRVGSQVGSFASGGATVQQIGQTSLQRSAIPFTLDNETPQAEIQYYTVQPGDTVLGIAERYGIAPETIIWSNTGLEQHVELIRPGDKLTILPINGAYHTVEPGDTLSTLAERYSVSMDAIVNYVANGLESADSPLTIGQNLVIPGGSRPFVEQFATAYTGPIPASAPIGSGSFVWPSSGRITQTYWSAHPAIDIGGWSNAPVKAADSGYVTLASTGWNTGYGNYVIIDHGNGFSTLYAHLNSIYVRAGESVARGQEIAGLGNTGNSTGPHLHLEIRYQGVPRNPMGYLP